MPTAITADEGLVVATDRNAPQGRLDVVIVDGQAAIFATTRQLLQLLSNGWNAYLRNNCKGPPDGKEMAVSLDFLKKQSLADFTHVMLNLNESLYVR